MATDNYIPVSDYADLLQACRNLLAAMENRPGKYVPDVGTNHCLEYERATSDIAIAVDRLSAQGC